MEINLGNYLTSCIYVGRNTGLDLREKLKLDEVDRTGEFVKIIVPEDVITVADSFFLGLFGKSVRNLGRSEFRSKYTFVCHKWIKEGFYNGIERALKERGGSEQSKPAEV